MTAWLHPDPVAAAGYTDPPARVGFFTDTSVCIGCKACEVACKEWNHIPEDGLTLTGMSYDNTVGLSADTWRHVAFIEQRVPNRPAAAGAGPNRPAAAGAGPNRPAAAGDGPNRPAAAGDGPNRPAAGGDGPNRPAAGGDGEHAPPTAPVGEPAVAVGGEPGGLRWLMSSDVCKHCTHAACLDVCPTGSLMRTEFGSVVVQQDICNGCGYCIPACPYGVIDQRKGDGRAWKCTLCYDRLGAGLRPACAQACPTESIQFGPLDELRARADRRLAALQEAGVPGAQLYGRDPDDGVGGAGAFFLLLDRPEVYGLPPDPVVTTRDLKSMWGKVGVAAGALSAAVAVAFFRAPR